MALLNDKLSLQTTLYETKLHITKRIYRTLEDKSYASMYIHHHLRCSKQVITIDLSSLLPECGAIVTTLFQVSFVYHHCLYLLKLSFSKSLLHLWITTLHIVREPAYCTKYW